jgi:hypothetical protein
MSDDDQIAKLDIQARTAALAAELVENGAPTGSLGVVDGYQISWEQVADKHPALVVLRVAGGEDEPTFEASIAAETRADVVAFFTSTADQLAALALRVRQGATP